MPDKYFNMYLIREPVPNYNSSRISVFENKTPLLISQGSSNEPEHLCQNRIIPGGETEFQHSEIEMYFRVMK